MTFLTRRPSVKACPNTHLTQFYHFIVQDKATIMVPRLKRCFVLENLNETKPVEKGLQDLTKSKEDEEKTSEQARLPSIVWICGGERAGS